tara:strand:+ start:442 stop:1476 length:1035 start_codon:yes stop_codon:yes gene_type:complete
MDLSSLPLLWTQLAILAVIILVAATQLTKSADVIAFKTGLGRSFVGVVLLATATSLPELGTGISSVAVIGGNSGADLAAGDAFGSNIFNLLIIGILDLLWRKGSIFATLGSSVAVVGVLGSIVILIAGAGILIHSSMELTPNFPISPISILLGIVFVVALFAIYREEQKSDSTESEQNYTDNSLTKAFVIYGISAIIVVVAAVRLAYTGEGLSEEMGWERSFVGTQFLALSTSLPELAASIAALRLLAPELAITNLLGSNLFNMGFVLFLDDVAFVDGPIWTVASNVHALTALIAVLMTMVVLVPLVSKSTVSKVRVVSKESFLLISLYVIASISVYFAGQSAH